VPLNSSVLPAEATQNLLAHTAQFRVGIVG
jgi:hypothetical protein